MCIAVIAAWPVSPFADAVGARFGEQQRLLPGDVLQPREVGAQLRLAVQVDVERADVEERQVEKLGRRKVDVGEAGCPATPLFASSYSSRRKRSTRSRPCQRTTPGGISLPSANSSDRRMVAELARPVATISRRIVALQRAIVEERDVLRPRQPDHHAQAVPRGLVEQVAARRRVDADRVDAELRHQPEVLGDLADGGELIAVRVGRERAVRDALDQEPLVAGAQELAVCS